MKADHDEESTFEKLRRVAEEIGATYHSARGNAGTAVGLGLLCSNKVVRLQKEIDGIEYFYLGNDSYAGSRGGSSISSGVYTLLPGADDLVVKIEESDFFNSVTSFFRRDDVVLGNRRFDDRFYVKGRATPRLRQVFSRMKTMNALERGLGISAPMIFEIRKEQNNTKTLGDEDNNLFLAGFETYLTWISDTEEITTLFEALHEIISAIPHK